MTKVTWLSKNITIIDLLLADALIARLKKNPNAHNSKPILHNCEHILYTSSIHSTKKVILILVVQVTVEKLAFSSTWQHE